MEKLEQTENTYKTFGQAIGYYRTRNGWTRTEAAQHANTTLNMWSRYERGTEPYNNPKRDLVARYACALMVPEGDLLVLAGYVPDAGLSDNKLSTLDNWRISQLPPHQLKMISEQAAFFYKQNEQTKTE